MTTDSHDWNIDPTEGKIYRRWGSAIVGDSLSPQVGLLESKWSAKARHIIALHSDSLTDGYPTHAMLLTNESSKKGTIYIRSTNSGGASYQLGKDYDTTNYANDAVYMPDFQFTPLWTEDSTQKMTRCVDSGDREFVTPGARKIIESGDYLFSPSAQGTPSKTNKRWNDTSGGGDLLRVDPWGHYSPMFMPTLTEQGGTTTQSAWAKDQQFFYSVLFITADRSPSQPKIPRDVNTTLTSGLGKFTFSTASNFYTSVKWSNIPIGPPGTRARVLLRSPAVLTTATTFAPPNLADLRVAAIINDNVSTVYYDTIGAEEGLLADAVLIRFDHEWARRARFVLANDARVVVGGELKPNPAALYVAPTAHVSGTSRELNIPYDSATGLGSTYRFFVRCDGTNLYLKYFDKGGPTKTTQTIALSGKTIQDVVDIINATTTASTAGEWCAEVAPGTDANVDASNLLSTDGLDFGDDSLINDATTGNIRAFCPAFPVTLYFSHTYMAGFDADDQEIRFTSASPTHAPSAAQSFYTRNRRKPPSRAAGRFVGGAALLDKFILCYERSIFVLRNIRGGGTGEDDDYRLVPLNDRRGCIAWGSIISGDGWVAYMTPDGYVATDGEAELLLSRDLWNREKGTTGTWKYEMDASMAATASNSDDAGFHAAVLGSRIRINYRESASVIRGIEYDYSSNHAASGLPELLRDSRPFGWGSPIRQSFGCMGEVVKSDGAHYYAAVNDNGGSTGDGRIDEFNTSTLADDNGATVTPEAFTATDLLDVFRKKSVQRVWSLHQKPTTGLSVVFYRGKSRSESYTKTLDSSGTDPYTRTLFELPSAARTMTDEVEFGVTDDGSGDNANFYMLELEAQVSASEV